MTTCLTKTFPFYVTVFSIKEDRERGAVFETQDKAEGFIEEAENDPDLVVIEYNFVSSV